MIYNQNLPTSFVSSSSSFTIVFAIVNQITRRSMYSAQICMRAWYGDAVVLIFHIRNVLKRQFWVFHFSFSSLCLSFFSLSLSEFHSNCFQFNAKKFTYTSFLVWFPQFQSGICELVKNTLRVCEISLHTRRHLDGNWWRQRRFLPRNPDTTLLQFPIMHASSRCK